MVGITVDIIDQIATPPLGTLDIVLDENGPYTFGNYDLDTFVTTVTHGLLPPGTHQVHGTYGVVIQLNGAIPTTWGVKFGYSSLVSSGNEGDIYENRICQAVLMHQLLGGAWVATDVEDVHRVPFLMQWPFRLIGGDLLGLNVSPGVAVDLFYLCVLA